MKEQVEAFFQVIFENCEGYICISTKHVGSDKWKDYFFSYPIELDQAVELALRKSTENDVYFCPNILGAKSCTKADVVASACIWADVDKADPADFTVQPSVIIQTSEGKTQAYWLLGEPCDPYDTETIAKSIAYENTTDKNGWNLARKLRVPNTFNHKYSPSHRVKVHDFNNKRHSVEDLKQTYQSSKGIDLSGAISTPAPTDYRSSHEVLEENKIQLNPKVFDLVENEPTSKDWSSSLWELELLLFEGGLDETDVFSVALDSACNKYERDGRPDQDLWNEVLRAKEKNHQSNDLSPTDIVSDTIVSPLLTTEQRNRAANKDDIVQEYIEWAKKQSDAAWQYHQAGIFIVLSTLLTGAVQLPMSFGTIRPNLWFMILGDTTLTRKSTAMDMAMDLLDEVDPDSLLATDGSIEGLLTQLSTRPGRPSLFLRDEITGLIESIQKKDYYAGMLETFTKLYDGKRQKRILRKEEIDVKDPNFLMFTGGIKSKMLNILTNEHITSGFMPRFCFVTAETDTTKLKPVGPAQDRDKTFYNKMVVRLIQLHKHFNHAKTEDGRPKMWDAELTEEAWFMYNQFEYHMVEDVVDSPYKEIYTPIMSRLANSGLKTAVLLAAIDPDNKSQVLVTEEHLIRAFYFVEQWREHAIEVVDGISDDAEDKKINKVHELIKNKYGISRGELMRQTKFKPQVMDAVISTLLQREYIISWKKDGRFLYRSTDD